MSPTSGSRRRRERVGRLAGEGADLAEEAQVVADGPVLDALAVLEADDVDLAIGEGSVGRGQAHEMPGVPAAEGAVQHHGVVFGDGLVDLPAPVQNAAASIRMD